MFFKPSAALALLLSITNLASASIDGDSICKCPEVQTNGDCTFWIGSVFAPGADGSYSCGIFNGNCELISSTKTCDPGTVLTSPLKYTVDVDERYGDGTGPNGIMAKVRYAGRTYGVAKRHDCSSGLVARDQGTFTFKCNL